MDRCDQLEQALAGRFTSAKIEADRTIRAGGPTFVDVVIEERQFLVNFNAQDPRYGLSSLPGNALTHGADEVYDSITQVLDRMQYLIETGDKTKPPP